MDIISILTRIALIIHNFNCKIFQRKENLDVILRIIPIVSFWNKEMSSIKSSFRGLLRYFSC